jgi:branched-chain amino acid transport system permease protein
VGIIEPALVFNPHLSALPLVFTIFGGRYQYYGPVLGALLLYPVDQLLFHSWLPRGHLALYGLIIVVTIFFLPQGVGTWLQKRLGFASS